MQTHKKKEKEKRMTREIKKTTAIWITLCDADRSSNTTQNRCQWVQMIEDEKNLTCDENEHAYLCYVLSLISVYCIIIFSNVERGFDVQQAIKKLLHATLSLYCFLFRWNFLSLFLSHTRSLSFPHPLALFRALLVSNDIVRAPSNFPLNWILILYVVFAQYDTLRFWARFSLFEFPIQCVRFFWSVCMYALLFWLLLLLCFFSIVVCLIHISHVGVVWFRIANKMKRCKWDVMDTLFSVYYQKLPTNIHTAA